MNLWITTKDLEDFIGQNENLELLEDSLSDTAKKYLALKQRKRKLNFGEKITPEALDVIVPKVIEETGKFLEVSELPSIDFELLTAWDVVKVQGSRILGNVIGIEASLVLFRGFEDITGYFTRKYPWVPVSKIVSQINFTNLEYIAGGLVIYYGIRVLHRYSTGGIESLISSHLHSEDKKIRLGIDNSVSVVADIAHEYTHVIQLLKNLGLEIRGAIKEGHARGVERGIAKIFAEQYDNPAYNYSSTERTARELKDAYLFICKKNHRSPRESIRKLDVPNKRTLVHIFLGIPSLSHHYSIGTAAFCIAEAQHGARVYRDVLRNDYSALQR